MICLDETIFMTRSQAVMYERSSSELKLSSGQVMWSQK